MALEIVSKMCNLTVWILVLGSVKWIMDTVHLGFAIHALEAHVVLTEAITQRMLREFPADVLLRLLAALTALLAFNELCTTLILFGSAVRHRITMCVGFWCSAYALSQSSLVLNILIITEVMRSDITLIGYIIYLSFYLVLQVTIMTLLRREYKKLGTTNRFNDERTFISMR